ncbi:MarR family transcriptional regulator [Kosakonia sp. 1610]|uniref:MarR family transcriptional regulator n=1 Tax=Kosakonia sp. 1610 TaxID=3156426 RepID=UPI003D1C02AF
MASTIGDRVLSSVLGYVESNPGVTARDISDDLQMDFAYASRIAKELTEKGILMRRRLSKGYHYSMPGEMNEKGEPLPPPALQASSTAMLLTAKETAASLMARGLYRRAATVLTGALENAYMDSEFKKVRALREKCLRMAPRARPCEYEPYAGSNVSLPVNGFFRN